MTELRPVFLNGMLGYIRPNGLFMPIIAGAEGDPGSEGGNEEEETTTEEEEEEEETETIKDPEARMKALESEKARHAKKAKKLEKDLADAQKKIQEHEDANKSELEKANEKASASDSRIAELQEQVQDLTLENQLLSNDKVISLPANRRKVVLKALIDDIEIDDDGESNISELLDDLEKSDPGLFKFESSEDEEEEEEETPPRRTAAPPKKKKDKGTVDRKQLEQRFPHLAKHR